MVINESKWLLDHCCFVVIGGDFKHICYFQPLFEMIQFDHHIFQSGWFNHQPFNTRKLPAFVERGGLQSRGVMFFFSAPIFGGHFATRIPGSPSSSFGWISRVYTHWNLIDFLFSWDFVRRGGANISWTELKLGLTSSWCVELIPWWCWIYPQPSNSGSVASHSSLYIQATYVSKCSMTCWMFMWGFPKMVVPNNHGFSY